MSGVERRRLFCAILFHLAAALCVIWSLCVLIERATEEVRKNQIGWPFWTKLVVVTVGLTGGVVFMYIQCKQYLQLCGRWRARNRILLIQNAPEKMHIPHSPPLPRGGRYGGNSAATAGSISNNSASLYRNIDFYDGGSAQAQVMANIESSAMNSERDFILDDASQLSFKPLRQGSGSINNMFDQRTNKSACSDSTTSNPIIQERRSVGSVYKVRCLESAVFLENADILNTNSDRKYYRHSSVLLLPAGSDSEKFDLQQGVPLQDSTRRYSDTKLLQHFDAVTLQQRLDEFLEQEGRTGAHSVDVLTSSSQPSTKVVTKPKILTRDNASPTTIAATAPRNAVSDSDTVPKKGEAYQPELPWGDVLYSEAQVREMLRQARQQNPKHFEFQSSSISMTSEPPPSSVGEYTSTEPVASLSVSNVESESTVTNSKP